MTVKVQSMFARRSISWPLGVALGAACAAGACSAGGGSGGDPQSTGQGGSQATASSSSGAGGDIGISGPGVPGPQGPFADFPATPILDTPMGGAAPPANAPDLFGPIEAGEATGGPCLIEPVPGTLYPNNWLRPRFRFVPVGGQNLFEIRIKAKNEINELVVYTTATDWKMPASMWKSLAANVPDEPMTVTVRGATLEGGALKGKPSAGTTGDIQIAPAAASGSIVYWRTDNSGNTGELKGFSAGDESVVSALKAEQVQVKPGGKGVTCLGCHTSTPDGKFAAFKTLGSTVGDAIAGVTAETTGQAPAFWSMTSVETMNQFQLGIPTFSKAHWQDGDHTLLTSWDNGKGAKLAWFDLEAQVSGEGQSFGFLARAGDAHGSIMPTWSHDGQSIVYISTNDSADGRPAGGDTDLFVVPYGSRKGGAATPLAGAADPAFNEYYPAFSPDDRFVAFNRINKGENTYNQPRAEVFVIPGAGGTPTRLSANDPIACSGEKSPGVTNSWPKWAPAAVTLGDRTFYWLTFSSTRSGGLPQLYVTAMVVQGETITTYPALYLWNQPSNEPNHTPAWDVFDLPPSAPPK